MRLRGLSLLGADVRMGHSSTLQMTAPSPLRPRRCLSPPPSRPAQVVVLAGMHANARMIDIRVAVQWVPVTQLEWCGRIVENGTVALRIGHNHDGKGLLISTS